MSERERQIAVDRPRCPFCRDDLLVDQVKTGCSACMAWHHTDCWREHGACSACGAANQSAEPTQTGIDPSALNEIRALKRRGQKIQAVKRYREEAGCDLKTAKEAVEALEASPPKSRAGSPRVDPKLEQALRANLKIDAIKRYQELHGGDLAAAKAAVDEIEATLGLGAAGEGTEQAMAIFFALFFAIAVAVLVAAAS